MSEDTDNTLKDYALPSPPDAIPLNTTLMVWGKECHFPEAGRLVWGPARTTPPLQEPNE